MAQKLKAFVVPHTHWDRAWYVPFEEFRLRLVRLVDRVCETLERDPSFTKFSLDGQTIVLEDYLAIRPQMADRLKKLVRSGRLLVGPWYILPDEFLVSGEAIVRNLMLGHRISAEFGHTMQVGYVPDPFGHVAQLPQILRGFGLDTFLFARGLDMFAEPDSKTEFEWSAPDGTSILSLHQRHFYNNAAFLGYRIVWGDSAFMVFDAKAAIERLRTAGEGLAPHALTPNLLLGNGVDHSEHQRELPAILKRANEKLPQYNFEIASFEDYAKAVKRALDGQKLQRRKGELIYPFGDMLHGVYSARMYLKTANQSCQDLLEKEAEPLSAMAWATDSGEYAQDQLWYAWRELLKNHPHDDICGCSGDPVHRDMEHRFGVVEAVGGVIARDSLRAIGRNVDNSRQEGVPVLVFNPLGAGRDEVFEVAVDFARSETGYGQGFVLYDEDGQEVPYDTVKAEHVEWMEVLKGFKVRRHTVALRLDVPPMGYRTLYARPGKPKRVKPVVKAGARSFENEHYTLRIADNGTLRLKDKTTGAQYKDLLLFEDVEDCGDEYNWSYLAENSQTLTTTDSRPAVEQIYSGPFSAAWRITHRFKVPQGLTSDRRARAKQTVMMEIVTEITCKAGTPRVDVVTRIDNNANDHRVRALFPTPIETDTVSVDEHFAVIERSVIRPPARPNLPPYPTQHQDRFADLTDGKRGFGIINDGLPEFEVVCEGKKRTLAQTLFRSVGWLTHAEAPLRPGLCGPKVEAPEGQCRRPMELRYGFLAHSGDWRAVLPEALRHNVGVRVSRCDLHCGTTVDEVHIYDNCDYILAQPVRPVPREGKLPDRASLVDIGNDALVLSAVKKCDTRNSLIVRLYNPGNTVQKGKLSTVRPIKAAHATNLNEKRLDALTVRGGTVAYACPPYRIMTFELTV